MTVAGVLAKGRRAAERYMAETVTINRLTGTVTTDPDTGETTDETVPVYEGKGRIHGDRAYEREHNIGSGAAILAEQRYFVSVPVDAGPFEVGDVVTVTASVHQPLLVGRRYRVAGRDERGAQTAQRMYVDLVP